MGCPTCKGKGKLTIPVTTHGEEGTRTTSFEMTCYTCNGTGTATPEQLAALEAMNAVWCRCGNPSGEPVYYEHADGSHGYNCADCGKLLQVG
jgi:DnaJ-class molecular chaperone